METLIVYGAHEFEAENEDEISFKAGERIIVLEKDDQYHDGWWQVRPSYCIACVKAIADGFPVSIDDRTNDNGLNRERTKEDNEVYSRRTTL